jgi:hypothetical protein
MRWQADHDLFGDPAGRRVQLVGSHVPDDLAVVSIGCSIPRVRSSPSSSEFERRAVVEGEWAGHVTGLGDQRVEIAMMRTPDGHIRLELSRFLRRMRSLITGTRRWALSAIYECVHRGRPR